MIRATLAAAVLAAAPALADPVDPAEVNFGGVDVVILGEVHDNPAHHANQAGWIARLAPRAVVFEMVPPDLALGAPPASAGAEVLGRALRWDDRGWPDFALYFPIFEAMDGAALFGAEIPREDARAAVSDGAAAVMGPAAAIFGLDAPLPPDDQAAREAEQAEAHCGALPAEMLGGMVEAQRLRDAALARAVIAALAETGPPVAVITGNGHARTDRGLPALLKRARPDLSVLSVGQLETPPGASVPYDLWVATGAPDRADPCDAFR